MKGINQFAANLLSYIPTKYYWNRSTSDLVIAKSERVNFFETLSHNIMLHILAKECCLSVTATADVYNIGAHHIVYFNNFAVRNVL